MENNLINNILNPQILSDIEYRDNLKGIISGILQERFPNDKQRQYIKVHNNRLQFCCPCCGDSFKDSSKKRGNIGLTGKWMNLYKCFNCGVSMSVGDFVKKYYGGSIPISMINYMSTNKPRNDTGFDASVNNSLEIYDQKNIDKYSIPRETLKALLNLVEVNNIDNWNYAMEYLTKRCQYDFSKFLYSRSQNMLYLLNLTKSGNIIGLQTRSLESKLPKNEPKYRTYNLTNIYKMLLKDYLILKTEIPQEIDTLSMLFNVLLVDYSKPINILEGPMDAFLLKNSVALCGASKALPFLGDFRFLFDDDKTGKTHAVERIKQGHTVFLWKTFKKENNIPNAEKWDVNDIVKYCKLNNLPLPNFGLSKYWSNDIFDAVMI